MTSLQERLFAMQDKQYAAFQAKLTPGVPMIGLSSIEKYSNCFRLTITPRKGVKVIVVSKGT